MKYQLTIIRSWGYRHPKRGRTALAPGVYHVPEQVSEDLARLAVAQGVATWQALPRTDPPPSPAPQVTAEEDKPPARKPKRPYRPRVKGPAPENKLFDVAANKPPVH